MTETISARYDGNGSEPDEPELLEPPELSGLSGKIKLALSLLPRLGLFMKYSKATLQEFAGRFKNPFLSQAVRLLADNPGWPMPRFPMLAMAGFAQSAVKYSGYPLGGSMKVVAGMADYYKKLAGRINYNSRVKDLIIENDTAVGIRLSDGTEHRADIVVWAGDGHKLIFDMLREKYISDDLRRIYREWIPVKPLVHIMFGVNMDLSKEPSKLIIKPEQPIKVANQEFK